MAFNYIDLDQSTRDRMIAEIDADVAKGSLYISPRLGPQGASAYPGLLKSSAAEGTEVTLAAALGQPGIFNSHESRNTKSGTTMAAIPYNANETLAEGEFNRFYIRAICLRAIEQAKSVTVYRAKQVANARSASEAMIGQTLDPSKVLNDLRNSIGVDTALGLPPGPNSGLTVRL